MVNDKSNNINTYKQNNHICNDSLVSKNIIDNLVFINLVDHLTFTNIIEIIIQNDNFQEYNPAKLNKQTKKIIFYIIKTYPLFFDKFENIFSDVIVENDKISLNKVHSVILLFKSLYKIVKQYKYSHLLFHLNIINICKHIITFTIYLLILDDRILLESQSQFQYNIINLFNICIGVDNFTNVTTHCV